MRWVCKTFSALTVHELYEILKLRVSVFVVEQECPYQEIDGHDDGSLHMFYADDRGIAAYARLLPTGVKYEEPSIGRVIVRNDLRGSGLAHQLMGRALAHMIKEWEPERIRLQGQTHLEKFYEGHGFTVVSPSYLEDGIPHVDMIYHNPAK